MSAKTERVEVRVDAATKARWQEAAGGPRKVSAWITELANSKVNEALLSTELPSIESDAPLPLVIPVIPSLDLTKVERHPLNVGTPSDAATADQSEPGAVISGSRPDSEGAPAKVEAPSPSIIEQESSAGQCPRWMHHRKGVYCGTCKRVN